MMPGDRVGGLLLQGFPPVLGAPAAGVGGVHPDHRQAAAGRHADQPISEPAGRYAGHDLAQPLGVFAAAEGLALLAERRPDVVVLGRRRA